MLVLLGASLSTKPPRWDGPPSLRRDELLCQNVLRGEQVNFQVADGIGWTTGHGVLSGFISLTSGSARGLRVGSLAMVYFLLLLLLGGHFDFILGLGWRVGFALLDEFQSPVPSC